MSASATVRTPRQIAELVRQMVAGDPNVRFSDLFAEDGVLEYPFAPPGTPTRLEGRRAIAEFHDTRVPDRRELFSMDGVDLTVHETTDPEVVIVEIEHHGTSHTLDGPYRFTALGVITVRDGEIVSYRDFMNPIAQVELLGEKAELAWH